MAFIAGPIAFCPTTIGNHVRTISTFLRCTRGATALEYAFIASLIAIACIVGISMLGAASNSQYSNVAEEVENAM